MRSRKGWILAEIRDRGGATRGSSADLATHEGRKPHWRSDVNDSLQAWRRSESLPSVGVGVSVTALSDRADAATGVGVVGAEPGAETFVRGGAVGRAAGGAAQAVAERPAVRPATSASAACTQSPTSFE